MHIHTHHAAGLVGGRQALSDAAPVQEAPMCTSTAHGHVAVVNALAYLPSRNWVASAGGDTTIRLWRCADLSHVATLRGHRGSVLCLLAAGAGSLLISGARDNTIRVWDLELDMMCRCTLTGHKDDVLALAGNKEEGEEHGATRGDLVVVSASADGSVRLWCVACAS